jgi:hypothetical protein
MKRNDFIFLFLISGIFTISCNALQKDDTRVKRIGRFNSGMAYGLVIQNSYAYVTTNSDLQIIDVANPKRPGRIGRLKLGQPVFGLKVRDGKAFLAATDNGLVIADISNPENPEILCKYTGGGSVRRLDLSGRYCITSEFETGLNILDISDVTAPEIVGNIRYDRIRVFQVSGDLIYLVDLNAGLRIVDISEKANPVEITLLEETNGASALAIRDNRLFLGFYDGPIKIYDLSNPKSPKPIKEIRCPGEVSGLKAVENFLLINYKGVIVKDVTDVNNILDIGYYREKRTRGGVHNIVYHNGYIFYVLHGLTVLEIQ